MLLLAAQEGQDAKDSLAVYKALFIQADTALRAAQKEIIRKEGVIVRMQTQRDLLREEKEKLVGIQSKQGFVIDQQNKSLIELNAMRPKEVSRFHVSIGFGYGYSLGETIVRAPVVAILLGFKLF